MDALLVNEVFCSLQGEGAFTGRPAFFIRLQGCSVACPWCDTGYALAIDEQYRLPDASEEVFQKKNASPFFSACPTDWLLKKLLSLPQHPRHAVITGGEPCRQDLRELTAGLVDLGILPQIETSGTEPIQASPETWITLSPKAKAILEENWTRASEIKLPVASEQDILRWKDKLLSLPPEKVRLQPVSQGRKATALCIETCMQYNWTLSLQTHKYIDLR